MLRTTCAWHAAWCTTDMPDEPRLVPAFWIWVVLTLLVVATGPLVHHHRASRQDLAGLDMTAK